MRRKAVIPPPQPIPPPPTPPPQNELEQEQRINELRLRLDYMNAKLRPIMRHIERDHVGKKDA